MAIIQRITIIASLVAAIPACGGAQEPAPATPASIAPSSPTASPQIKETPAEAASSGSIQIADEILKACGISSSDAFFPFDSARLEKQDIQPLNDVAKCFATGPLKGRVMKLIGHADPRGAPDYNLTLGQARADTVQKYIVTKGVTAGNVTSTSRGAIDATGTDEATWAHDRRVDIVLGG